KSSFRGTTVNPPNRFEPLHLEPDPDSDLDPEVQILPRTKLFRDLTGKIITYNESPDVPMEATINPYRGCEHGCAYCYARPTHEYLGFSAGLDFETKIMVKQNAAELLRAELSAPRYKAVVLGLSGVTDCYQPIERRLKLTRACLEVLLDFRNPVGIVTKNILVTRDIDLLAQLARFNAVCVNVSVTSLDGELRGALEPRTSPPAARLSAICRLAQAGVPVGVMIGPVIPGLNDHEIPAILAECARAGASFAGYEMLRLPYAVAPIFEEWLGKHFPLKKEKVLSRIRAVRGGKLNDPRFGSRMTGEGIFAQQVNQVFHMACRKAGLNDGPDLSTAAFRIPEGAQLGLPL
ncbi:PA0069 family radical SAM protein, partial [bacterium]|nr:PA0069 family radical SAM protein [bacterium]